METNLSPYFPCHTIIEPNKPDESLWSMNKINRMFDMAMTFVEIKKMWQEDEAYF